MMRNPESANLRVEPQTIMTEADGKAIVNSIEKKLTETLQASYVKIDDLSDGCGAKLDLIVVSDQFEGKPLLERQRSVHDAIAEEMKVVHAITMKTKTVKQWEAMKEKEGKE